LWQLASQQACHGLEIRASWIDVEQPSDPGLAFDGERLGKLQESLATWRPAALIIGIDRAGVRKIARAADNLRQLCRRVSWAAENTLAASDGFPFLIGWFPDADGEAIQLLRLLGFDLVLYHPARLRPILTKIIDCHGRSRGSLDGIT